MNIHCVGYAGAYPFHQEPIAVRWQLMESHISSDLRMLRTFAGPLLEQDVLPPLEKESHEQPSIRFALCGMIWDSETAYGGSFSSLLHLQHLLDRTFPACLDRFSGDFSLAYLSPDHSLICLYRSITCTRCLYYRVTDRAIMWSTNPADLFPFGQPTLAEIDVEMVAILTATGQADPSRTCYQQVLSVPPGDCLCWKPDGTQSHRHFDYVRREDNTHVPSAQAAKRLREQVEAAVSRTLSGFSSPNVLLSGGLDTSIIAYEVSRQRGDVHGYHWTWQSEEKQLFHDEDQAAQEVADLLGISLHTLDFSASIAHTGDYVRSMYGLALPYNHAFYTCYAQTMMAVHAVRRVGDGYLLVGGHLGDTLFQGDWADAFRLRRKSPFTLFHTLFNLLAWYPRGVALATWWYLLTQDQRDLEENLDRDRLEVHRSLMTPSFFERVLAKGNVDYRQHSPRSWKNLSAECTRAGLQSSLDFSAHLQAAFQYRDAIPQGVILRHPLSDRQLHEFCLSLGAHHRTRWYAGQTFSKFLLRLAYVGDLPPSVIKSERRAPYASVSEQFCFNNRTELAEIFSPKSYLVQLGILDAAAIQEMLPDATLRQKHSRSLVRMSGVEMWLRGLAQEPLRDQERSVEPLNPLQNEGDHTHPQQSQSVGLLTLCEGVLMRSVNTALILVNTSTLEVCRLDEEAVHYWQALCLEPTWARVFARLQQMYPQDNPNEIKGYAQHFADELVRQNWAVAQKKEEEACDVCTNNPNDI
jgi:asparagine synthetase B (glutamine-hydrolysing)